MRPQRGEAQAKLAIADRGSPAVHLYDARSGSNEAVGSASVHRAPVVAMRFNEPHDTVISADEKGTWCLFKGLGSGSVVKPYNPKPYNHAPCASPIDS